MNPIIRNILAVIAGAVVGSIVNMGILQLNGILIPLPEGADVSTMESLKESMNLFRPQHFIIPFLAHAGGTFVGAWMAALIAANRKMTFALVIGVLFLIGGIANVMMLPSPLWYTLVDLILAYLPFAWLGGLVSASKKSATNA